MNNKLYYTLEPPKTLSTIFFFSDNLKDINLFILFNPFFKVIKINKKKINIKLKWTISRKPKLNKYVS